MAHTTNSQKIKFLAKSLLWSTLLYLCTIIALDWNDLKTHFTGDNNNPIVRTNIEEQTPSYSISVDTIGKKIRTIPKSILTYTFSNFVKKALH